MISLRPSNERGHFDNGWLNTYHSFSFADYYDPAHMGFRDLRVINEDVVAPGQGFGTHPHRDMEIITYMLDGALEHKDSMGNGSVIQAGEIQRMSAGTGVTHSEFNHHQDRAAHLLQIWILPAKKGIEPSYEQKKIDQSVMQDNWYLLASPKEKKGLVTIHQDVLLYAACLEPRKYLEKSLDVGRHAWLQVASGAVLVNDVQLKAGDGAAVSDEKKIKVSASKKSEILLFDLR